MTELQLTVTAAPLTTCCCFDAHIAHTPRCAPYLVQLSNSNTRTALTFAFVSAPHIEQSHTDIQNKMHSCRNRNKNPNSTQFFTALFAQLQTQTMQVQATVRVRLSDSLTDTCLNVPVERQDSSN